MTLRSVYSPAHGRHVKVGGRKPSDPLALATLPKLSRYLRGAASAPTPPATGFDYTALGAVVLAMMLGNDQYGDCAEAATVKSQGVSSLNAGNPFTAADPGTALQLYAGATGFNPNAPPDANGQNPTDQGTDLVSLFNYLKSNPMPNGEELAGWCTCDATNLQELTLGLYLVESGIGGLCLPKSCTNPFPSGNGAIWDGQDDPQPEDGHAILLAGANPHGFPLATWGLILTATPRFVGKFFTPAQSGEFHFLFWRSQMNRLTQKSPLGLDWASLQADLPLISL